MAEFKEIGIGTRLLPPVATPGEDGFSAMGKPIPIYRKQAGFEHCKSMGMEDSGVIMALIGGMSDKLERDEPYEAMAVGMRYLDLTGTYRLMAVLLTAEKPREVAPEASYLDFYMGSSRVD